mmetsp:Transcript_6406/g.9394  ORF Transcript_6406/g.9394 Transcript_6406/m.9394 type:complete len:81 (-) Transcript_6406:112-354(-)|eukprot:CAMPEP_0197257504 /NCGR_PEP_ID=MMETSP1429-20130617/78927_1 /TAXON_ID=49237 /ORGANISM="Chaetoceros  sp., Strain UNC1202" /LENGTH=80 /DNA_ID=CAMNT_0042721359 /DNA_START=173 /DNA_END=415 /DNA_ORIENTATION=+
MHPSELTSGIASDENTEGKHPQVNHNEGKNFDRADGIIEQLIHEGINHEDIGDKPTTDDSSKLTEDLLSLLFRTLSSYPV